MQTASPSFDASVGFITVDQVVESALGPDVEYMPGNPFPPSTTGRIRNRAAAAVGKGEGKAIGQEMIRAAKPRQRPVVKP